MTVEEESFQPQTESAVYEENISNIQLAATATVQYQKKSSIFKSRSNASTGNVNSSSLCSSSSNSVSVAKKELLASSSKGKKGLALYRHKWHEDKESGGNGGSSGGPGGSAAASHPDGGQHPQTFNWDELGEDGQDSQPPSKLARIGTLSKQLSHHSGNFFFCKRFNLGSKKKWN